MGRQVVFHIQSWSRMDPMQVIFDMWNRRNLSAYVDDQPYGLTLTCITTLLQNANASYDTPSPALSMLPLGSDNNTWKNVVRNKRNMLYCDTTFQTLGNRERCITDFTSSGLLD